MAAETYYEVVIFNHLGDFFEMHMESEPNFSCVRLQSHCHCESADEHDHFLIGENEDKDDPPPTSRKYLAALLAVKYYIDHKRPKQLGAISYPQFYRYFLEVTFGCPKNVTPLVPEAEVEACRKFVADNKYRRGKYVFLLVIPVNTAEQLYNSIRDCHAAKIRR